MNVIFGTNGKMSLCVLYVKKCGTVTKMACSANDKNIFSVRQLLNYTLISTSTPLGSSSFISASTVFAVEL